MGFSACGCGGGVGAPGPRTSITKQPTQPFSPAEKYHGAMEADVHTTLPHRVALVDGAPAPNAPTTLVLADLAEALPVYAHLAGVEAPELVDVPGACRFDGCNTVLLVLSAESDDAAPALPVGTRIYAVAIASGRDPAPARDRLNAARKQCEKLGARWMGGLALGGAEMVARTTRSPRMGWLRRRRSEAEDRLLMALLAGEHTADEDVAAPLPRPLYRFIYQRVDSRNAT